MYRAISILTMLKTVETSQFFDRSTIINFRSKWPAGTLFLSVLLCSVTGSVLAQQSSGKSELSRPSLEAGTQQLVTLVKKAIKQSGGDLERSNANWVFAFSTGHYKSDPLGAQAAREIATQFVNRVAVTGDSVTARAWELAPWSERDSSLLTLKLGSDLIADKARVSALWPTSSAVGSAGGHDTERAAASFTQEFQNDAGSVLILLTNTAASVGAPGEKLLGQNAPEYQEALTRWNRVAGTQDGASLDLPYVVKAPSGDVQGQLQAVVFVPKTFTAAALSQSRTALLGSQQNAAAPAAGPRLNPLPFIILLVLIALGFVVWRLLGGKGSGGGSATLRVGDQSFALRDLPQGRPFCVIAGPGYQSESQTPVVPVPGLPAESVAELSRQGREIKVRGTSETIRLSSVGGKVVAGDTVTLRLKPDQPDQPLEFSGEVRSSSGVPREVNKTVNVAYTLGDA